MTVGIFLDVFNQFAELPEKYHKIGYNTGNILFMAGLRAMFDCEVVRDWEESRISEMDAFITTDLIWIQQSAVPPAALLKRLELTKGKPLVPLSIGLQADRFDLSFRLKPEMVDVLKELESRCTLPVRGSFTAEILEKHGIQDVKVIGCPSVYQLPLFQKSLDFLGSTQAPQRACANYRSFVGHMTDQDTALLKHIARRCDGFIEQTLHPLSATNLRENVALTTWFDHNSHLFFDLESWVRHNTRYDFSYGLRFHGNVAALLAGIRSLFIFIDSRTREMTEHFNFPAIRFDEFSPVMSLAELRELADYTKFRRTYPQLLVEFSEYAAGVGLTLSSKYRDSLAAFQGAAA